MGSAQTLTADAFNANQQIICLLLNRKPLVNFKVVNKTVSHIKSNIVGGPEIVNDEVLLIRLR